VSDSENLNDRLEVIFERNNSQPRRRASMQPSEGPAKMRPRHQRKTTSCFVHSLLSYKAEEGQWTPNSEAEFATKAADKPTESHQEQVEPHTQSRLLSKKQLSDMAFNIRELSK
jgi:NAD+ kinase